MSKFQEKVTALNTLLNSSIAGVSPQIDLAGVLGMLESMQVTGIFRAREGVSMECKFYLRFLDGHIVKTLGGTPGDVVEAMLRSKELYWNFRSVSNRPRGDVDESVTALLLNAVTAFDHDVRDGAEDGASSLVSSSRLGSQLRLVRKKKTAGVSLI